jgi:hypothetical protein
MRTARHDRLPACFLLAVLAAVGTPCLAQEAEAPRPTTSAAKHIERALEQAGVRFEFLPDEEDGLFRSGWQTNVWVNAEGEASAYVQIFPDIAGDVVVAFPLAYDLSLCRHTNACRKVLSEAYWKAGVRSTLVLDPDDAEVRAVLRAPGQAGRIEAKVLRDMVERALSDIDRIDPVMRKAMDTGNVDWPADDQGPKEPTQRFRARFGEGEPFEMGVANWIEPEIFASTLIAFDEFGQRLVDVNDEEAEIMGSVADPISETS